MIPGDQCTAIPVADQCSPSIFSPDGGGSPMQLAGVLKLTQPGLNLIEIEIEPGLDTSDSTQFSQVNSLILIKGCGLRRHSSAASTTWISDKFDARFPLLNISTDDGSGHLTRSMARRRHHLCSQQSNHCRCRGEA